MEFINFDITDLTESVKDLTAKLPALTLLLNLYTSDMYVEKDVGVFYQIFLPGFIDIPHTSQREVVFNGIKPTCPQGSVDCVFGRTANGSRPVAQVKDNDAFSTVYVVTINETKLGKRLSGFLKDSMQSLHVPAQTSPSPGQFGNK